MIVVSQFVQSMLGDNPDNPEVIIEFFNQRAVEFTSRVSINSFKDTDSCRYKYMKIGPP